MINMHAQVLVAIDIFPWLQVHIEAAGLKIWYVLREKSQKDRYPSDLI